jgi:phage terminase large subunit-like protein
LLAQVSAINPYATAADTAPAGIVVCGVLHREKFPGFWVQDCSACTYAIPRGWGPTGRAFIPCGNA